jgi:hypothetical protein
MTAYHHQHGTSWFEMSEHAIGHGSGDYRKPKTLSMPLFSAAPARSSGDLIAPSVDKAGHRTGVERKTFDFRKFLVDRSFSKDKNPYCQHFAGGQRQAGRAPVGKPRGCRPCSLNGDQKC